jgi:hypothetical protein
LCTHMISLSLQPNRTTTNPRTHLPINLLESFGLENKKLKKEEEVHDPFKYLITTMANSPNCPSPSKIYHANVFLQTPDTPFL